MLRTRVIPSLLLEGDGLVKTEKFRNARYIGDPINAIRIFNEKEVDELVLLDISATRRGSINYELLARISKEAFMPLGYGGGIRSTEDVKRVLGLGFEKVVINSSALDDLSFIYRAASLCGTQSVVACIDSNRTLLGHREVYSYLRRKNIRREPAVWAKDLESAGAGEIILYSVDRDGTFSGYDCELIRNVAASISIPLVALGGARGLADFKLALESGASAVAAGSYFVFHGARRAVLITYPPKEQLRSLDRNYAAPR